MDNIRQTAQFHNTYQEDVDNEGDQDDGPPGLEDINEQFESAPRIPGGFGNNQLSFGGVKMSDQQDQPPETKSSFQQLSENFNYFMQPSGMKSQTNQRPGSGASNPQANSQLNQGQQQLMNKQQMQQILQQTMEKNKKGFAANGNSGIAGIVGKATSQQLREDTIGIGNGGDATSLGGKSPNSGISGNNNNNNNSTSSNNNNNNVGSDNLTNSQNNGGLGSASGMKGESGAKKVLPVEAEKIMKDSEGGQKGKLNEKPDGEEIQQYISQINKSIEISNQKIESVPLLQQAQRKIQNKILQYESVINMDAQTLMELEMMEMKKGVKLETQVETKRHYLDKLIKSMRKTLKFMRDNELLIEESNKQSLICSKMGKMLIDFHYTIKEQLNNFKNYRNTLPTKEEIEYKEKMEALETQVAQEIDKRNRLEAELNKRIVDFQTLFVDAQEAKKIIKDQLIGIREEKERMKQQAEDLEKKQKEFNKKQKEFQQQAQANPQKDNKDKEFNDTDSKLSSRTFKSQSNINHFKHKLAQAKYQQQREEEAQLDPKRRSNKLTGDHRGMPNHPSRSMVLDHNDPNPDSLNRIAQSDIIQSFDYVPVNPLKGMNGDDDDNNEEEDSFLGPQAGEKDNIGASAQDNLNLHSIMPPLLALKHGNSVEYTMPNSNYNNNQNHGMWNGNGNQMMQQPYNENNNNPASQSIMYPPNLVPANPRFQSFSSPSQPLNQQLQQQQQQSQQFGQLPYQQLQAQVLQQQQQQPQQAPYPLSKQNSDSLWQQLQQQQFQQPGQQHPFSQSQFNAPWLPQQQPQQQQQQQQQSQQQQMPNSQSMLTSQMLKGQPSQKGVGKSSMKKKVLDPDEEPKPFSLGLFDFNIVSEDVPLGATSTSQFTNSSQQQQQQQQLLSASKSSQYLTSTSAKKSFLTSSPSPFKSTVQSGYLRTNSSSLQSSQNPLKSMIHSIQSNQKTMIREMEGLSEQRSYNTSALKENRSITPVKSKKY